MSVKMTCPVCQSHSSSVAAAVRDLQPCPVCGTPAGVIEQVSELREAHAESALRARVEGLLVEVGRLTAERDRLRDRLDNVRAALDDD